MAITTQLLNSKGLITQGIPQTTSFVNNSFSTDTNGGIQFPLQKGVPMKSIYVFKITPAPSGTSASKTCVAQAQAITNTGGGNLTLNAGNSTTGSPDGYVQNYSYRVAYSGAPIVLTGDASTLNPRFTGGANCILLDCERTLSITNAGSAATTAPVNVTIGGWDYRGTPVAEQFTIDSGLAAGSNRVSEKTYSIVGYVNISGNAGTNVLWSSGIFGQAGSSVAGIGLPYFLSDINDCISLYQAGISYAPSAYVIPGTNWRSLTAPTITSNAACGRLEYPVTPDGQETIVLTYLVYGSDSETNANVQNLYEPTLLQYAFQTNQKTPAQYVLPYLTINDLTGMQYPGDIVQYQAYVKACAAT